MSYDFFYSTLENVLSSGCEEVVIKMANDYIDNAHRYAEVAGHYESGSPMLNGAIQRILRNIEAKPSLRPEFEKLAVRFKALRDSEDKAVAEKKKRNQEIVERMRPL